MNNIMARPRSKQQLANLRCLKLHALISPFLQNSLQRSSVWSAPSFFPLGSFGLADDLIPILVTTLIFFEFDSEFVSRVESVSKPASISTALTGIMVILSRLSDSVVWGIEYGEGFFFPKLCCRLSFSGPRRWLFD